MTEASAVGQPAKGGGIKRCLAILGAGLLAACSTVVPRGPVEAPTRPGRPQAQRPDAPIEAGLPRDTQRNRVALLVPLSGANSGVGRSIANATMLAVLDTGTDKVRITTTIPRPARGRGPACDRRGRPADPGAAAGRRRARRRADRQGGGRARAELSNDVSVAGNGVYLMGYVPGQSIDRVVQYARSRGVSTFAGLIPNGLYGERASTAFLRSVEGAGGSVVSLQTYGRTAGGVTGAVTRLNAKAPYDAVLVADAGTTAAVAAPLIKRGSGASTRILGTELWNSENGLAAKPALSGAWFASVSNTLYRQYAAKYRARYNAGPYRLSSLGYDAVLLTVRIARDWPVGRAFPESKLRDGDGFAGIDGAFRFGRDGVAERALEVQEIQAGGLVTVSPAPSGFGK